MKPLEAMVERRTPDTFRNQVEALLNRPDAGPLLASIRCPTLVLCGREDGWSPLAQHEQIAAAIRGSVLAVIDKCGHMAPFERPAEVTRELCALARLNESRGTAVSSRRCPSGVQPAVA